MTKKDKLIARLQSRPKDFRYEEAAQLMGYCGYKEYPSQSGSRVRFQNKQGRSITMHKPHGPKQNTLLSYMVLELEKFLKDGGDL